MISKKEEQHMNQNLVFYDDATGMPLFHASLPSTFAGRAKLTTETSKDNTRKVSVIGMAKDSGTETELYFESGKVYTDDRQPGTLIVHPLCSAAEQLLVDKCDTGGCYDYEYSQFHIMGRIKEWTHGDGHGIYQEGHDGTKHQ